MTEPTLLDEEVGGNYPGIAPVGNDELLARCVTRDDHVFQAADGNVYLTTGAFSIDDIKGKDNRSVSVFRKGKIDEDCLSDKAKSLYKGNGSPGYATALAGMLRKIEHHDGHRQLRIVGSPEYDDDGVTVVCIHHADITAAQSDENKRLPWKELRRLIGDAFGSLHKL